MNISEHIDKFNQEMKRRHFSENTIRNYSNNIKLFFEQSVKDHPKNITENDIRDFLCKFDEPNTQRSYHGAIKKFYDICLNQKNKFKYIPYARKSKKLPIILSQEEVQKMFDVCDNLKHKVILALLYSTGIRSNELINLKWSDIDRQNKVIMIRQAKGFKDRQVPLSDCIIPLLEKYYREYRPKEFILNGQFDLQYSKSSVNQSLKLLAQKAGINKNVYTHLMRHNTFSHMVQNGIDIELISIIAGHSNSKITASVYCHVGNNIISKIKSPIQNINL